MPQVKVSPEFAVEWYEQWAEAQNGGRPNTKEHLEKFLARIGPDLARALKPQLLVVLIEDAAAHASAHAHATTTGNPQDAQQNSPGTQISA